VGIGPDEPVEVDAFREAIELVVLEGLNLVRLDLGTIANLLGR
jgi:hypothetical protein